VITYLTVRNLAIVEEFSIEPGAGFNVLTGETGAGKSLLIDSLEFLRGARGSTEMIRSGAEKMSAEASFEAGEELIVKRELSAAGRGRVLVNGSLMTVRELQETMEPVLDIHGQSDARQRIAGQTARELLDEYADHKALLEATRTAHAAWRRVAEELQELTDARRDRALRLDLLKYQIDEIAAARLDPGEEEALRADKSVLANAREMIDASTAAFGLVEDDDQSAIAQLVRAQHRMQPLTRDVESVRAIADELQEVIYRLQESGRSLAGIADSVRIDPARLDEVEERLVTIERLKKKYGGSVESVLEHLATITSEHDRLSDSEANLERLQAAETAKESAYHAAAEKLSASRKKAGRALEKAIESELRDLAMERTTIRVMVERDRESAGGFDRVDLLIAPNRGEEPKPMDRIASGGELSRIQLAVAAALFKSAQHPSTATLVFDEIDAGIGGRVAEVVGKKLQELARRNQVVCVTHLPQIASRADIHFFVWKEDVRGQTRASIRKLESHEERVSELARMLGGETIPASAVLHARELLESARAKPARARS
jgi:DNA repair protein RecN (Recombination protein N)